MLLSWLSKLLASLLVPLLFSVAVTTVLNSTVLNSHYLEGQLASTNSYQHLSVALSSEVAQKAGTTDPAVQAKLQTILTPTALQQKINGALDQLQAYYKGNGQAPVIDFSDLTTQVQASGVPIGSDSGVTKPVTLGNNQKAQNVGSRIQTVRVITTLSSIVLFLLLLLICWKRHRYTALTGVLISVGVSLGLLALFLGFVPGLVNHYGQIDTNSNAFASIAHDLAISILHDLSKRFGVIAAVTLIIGIGGRIWISRYKKSPRPVNPSQPPTGLPR